MLTFTDKNHNTVIVTVNAVTMPSGGGIGDATYMQLVKLTLSHSGEAPQVANIGLEDLAIDFTERIVDGLFEQQEQADYSTFVEDYIIMISDCHRDEMANYI